LQEISPKKNLLEVQSTEEASNSQTNANSQLHFNLSSFNNTQKTQSFPSAQVLKVENNKKLSQPIFLTFRKKRNFICADAQTKMFLKPPRTLQMDIFTLMVLKWLLW
jgi:hypothetical protein